MKKVFIIAEAGVNHNGDINLAKQLIDVAVDAGADAVKFQTFKADLLVTKSAEKADYQKESTSPSESQYLMLKKLEQSYEEQKILQEYCHGKRIMFLSTAFDLESLDFLNSLELPIYKIPSGEITNLPYLRKIASFGKEVILSTGMANLGEIEDAIEALEDGGLDRNKLSVLHCSTEYPTPIENTNLKAMISIRDSFKIKVGYSDHTLGIEVPIAAVALGAEIIEKHFTLDKNMDGPDHKASLNPTELKEMIRSIRMTELALGDGVKRPSANELKIKTVVRKSIVAQKDIKKGEILNDKNLTVKRPGVGVSPMKWDQFIGQEATKDYSKDDFL